LLRVTIVAAHVLWTMACEAGLARGHPFVWASQTIRETPGAYIVGIFKLGPRPVKEKVEKKD
jgi:hypothetical protein